MAIRSATEICEKTWLLGMGSLATLPLAKIKENGNAFLPAVTRYTCIWPSQWQRRNAHFQVAGFKPPLYLYTWLGLTWAYMYMGTLLHIWQDSLTGDLEHRVIIQHGGPNVVYHISVNIAYIGTTLPSMYRGDMWFHHIPKWQIIEDKSSISTFQNHIQYM